MNGRKQKKEGGKRKQSAYLPFFCSIYSCRYLLDQESRYGAMAFVRTAFAISLGKPFLSNWSREPVMTSLMLQKQVRGWHFLLLFLIFALYKVIAESSAAHSYFFSFLFFSFLFFSSSCLAACTLVDWHFLSWVCFFHAKMVESIGLSRPRPQQWRPSKKMQIKSDRHKRGFVQ